MLTILVYLIRFLNLLLYLLFILASQVTLDRKLIAITGLVLAIYKIFIEKYLIVKCKTLFYKGVKSKYIRTLEGYETFKMFGMYMERGRRVSTIDKCDNDISTSINRILKLIDMTTVASILESINILFLLISLYLNNDTRIISISTVLSIILANSLISRINDCTIDIVINGYKKSLSNSKDYKVRKLLKEKTNKIEGQRLIEIGNCSFIY